METGRNKRSFLFDVESVTSDMQNIGAFLFFGGKEILCAGVFVNYANRRNHIFLVNNLCF